MSEQNTPELDQSLPKLDRRDFLKGAAASALGVGAAAALAACTPNEPAPPAEEPPAAGSDAPETPAGSEPVSEGGLDASVLERKWDFETPPAPIADDLIAETISADVVVVGAGTAGLVTACSALDEGLAVVVVSASSKPISRGGSNNAIYSKVMERMGFERQSPEIIQKEMAMNYNHVDQKKWYKYYNNSEEAMNWLIDIMEGAGFETAIERTSNMAEDSLFYCAPAAHGWINDEDNHVGMTQPFVVNTLAQKVLDDGGQIFYKNIGRQLVRGGTANGTSGRVSAVIAEREDGTYAKYEATKAVVLACGDFSANRDLMAKYATPYVSYVADEMYDAEPDYDKEFAFGGLFPGDGHLMGLWAGAAWQKTFPNAPMGGTLNAGTTPNPYQNFWGLLVDRSGERFMNEYCSNILGGIPQAMAAGAESYAIWDTDYSNLPDWYSGQGGYGILEASTPAEIIAMWEQSVETGMYVKADTIEELVSALGLPPETLQTIERYNGFCDSGVDTEFYKRKENLFPVRTAPFYGQKASGTPGMLTILGGLRTNANMQVCDEDDNPLEGLYNVGTMVGDFYAGYYTFQVEGVNYGATCDTFGYITGKYIAANE
ncbi:MAG: FAD-dependent oxidoreductase [Coriobacteriales bacterium]|jgi:succinate dehydrogenase/fumarate reductase flavoprotein subunit|nr:FAD-dependent oxidoreductase [Coriobacteriales bacterium]